MAKTGNKQASAPTEADPLKSSDISQELDDYYPNANKTRKEEVYDAVYSEDMIEKDQLDTSAPDEIERQMDKDAHWLQRASNAGFLRGLPFKGKDHSFQTQYQRETATTWICIASFIIAAVIVVFTGQNTGTSPAIVIAAFSPVLLSIILAGVLLTKSQVRPQIVALLIVVVHALFPLAKNTTLLGQLNTEVFLIVNAALSLVFLIVLSSSEDILDFSGMSSENTHDHHDCDGDCDHHHHNHHKSVFEVMAEDDDELAKDHEKEIRRQFDTSILDKIHNFSKNVDQINKSIDKVYKGIQGSEIENVHEALAIDQGWVGPLTSLSQERLETQTQAVLDHVNYINTRLADYDVTENQLLGGVNAKSKYVHDASGRDRIIDVLAANTKEDLVEKYVEAQHLGQELATILSSPASN